MAQFPGCLDNFVCPDGVPRGCRHVCAAQLWESCVDIRELQVRDEGPEYDVDEVIVSLESQVDHLCSLVDTFRSEFQQKLHAFCKEVKNLPDRVGDDYTPRQRAYLLKLYGKQLTEGGELALHRLQQDLAHLISLDGDNRPHGYPSTAPALASSVDVLETRDAVVGKRTAKPSGLQLLTSLLRSARLEPAGSPTLASTSPDRVDSSIIESVPDHDNDDNANDDIHGHKGKQEYLTATQSIPLGPRWEVVIDEDCLHGG